MSINPQYYWNIKDLFSIMFSEATILTHILSYFTKCVTDCFSDAAWRTVSQRGVHLQPHAHSGEGWWDAGTEERQGIGQKARQGGERQTGARLLHGGREGQRLAAGPAGAFETPLLQLQGLALQCPHRGKRIETHWSVLAPNTKLKRRYPGEGSKWCIIIINGG